MSIREQNDTLNTYLQDIAHIAPLSKEHELSIGKRIAQLQELSDLHPEEHKIRKEQIDIEKQKLVRANLKLVVLIAKRYARSTKAPIHELIAEGNLGLVEAVERFDYSKDCKFSTYAVWWIRLYMNTYASQKIIAVPSYMGKLIRQLHAVYDDLRQELHREAHIEEVATRMGITTDKVMELQNLSFDVSSLSAPIGDDELSSLEELIPDKKQPSTVHTLVEQSVSRVLSQAMQSLSTREREILIRHNGLGDAAPETLDAISEDFGLSRERIRQIEKVAIEKLRRDKSLQALQDIF